MTLASIVAMTIMSQTAATPALKDSDFILFEAPTYSFEIPKEWKAGKETPWGSRDIKPAKGEGKMTAMTANASNSTWDDLYRTSLYFINREKKAEATPYREGKTKNGYPCISFEMKEQDGWKDRYYTLIQAPDKSALALSVKIPSKAEEKTYLANFQRMVDTTKFK